jgi:hypothetical protein
MTVQHGLTFDFTKQVQSDVSLELNVDKQVQSTAVVIGNLADAQANATATGPNSLAETDTVSNVAPAHDDWGSMNSVPNFTSTAFSESVSSANGSAAALLMSNGISLA